MAKKHYPRFGSLAFYPKKRAKRETPTFSFVKPETANRVQPLCFLGYKAGMTQIIGKNAHDKSRNFGQDTSLAVTIVECPPLGVFGIRLYEKTPQGTRAIGEVHSEKNAKELVRKIPNFMKTRGTEQKKKHAKKKKTTLDDVKGKLSETAYLVLLAHSQPKFTGMGKKKPDVFEIPVSGTVEQQFAFAAEKLGKEITVQECFDQGSFVDVKAVDKGKGMQGPVKRMGVKTHRPKAKKQRVVGSISPWNPSTVMWTVARPGQLGYQTRTEYNRRVMMIGDAKERITPAGGFKQYGNVNNTFLMLSGSVPGPQKRAIALRQAIRVTGVGKYKIDTIDYIASKGRTQAHATEDAAKAEKVVHAKEEKAHQKSVQEEIAEAARA